MIFPAAAARALVAGRRTEFRVPVREPQDVQRRNGTWRRTRPWQPSLNDHVQVDRVEIADGRRQLVTLGLLIVVGFSQELAGDITAEAAKAEGTTGTAAWKAEWVRCHDDWARGHIRLAGELAPSADPSFWIDTPELVHRFERRHASTPVWACRVLVDQAAPPRWLHKQSDALYTTNEATALTDPDGSRPEAVDDATLARFAKDNADHFDHHRAVLLAEQEKLECYLELEQRLGRLEALARRRGIDVTGDARVARARLDAARRRIDAIEDTLHASVAPVGRAA